MLKKANFLSKKWRPKGKKKIDDGVKDETSEGSSFREDIVRTTGIDKEYESKLRTMREELTSKYLQQIEGMKKREASTTLRLNTKLACITRQRDEMGSKLHLVQKRYEDMKKKIASETSSKSSETPTNNSRSFNDGVIAMISQPKLISDEEDCFQTVRNYCQIVTDGKKTAETFSKPTLERKNGFLKTKKYTQTDKASVREPETVPKLELLDKENSQCDKQEPSVKVWTKDIYSMIEELREDVAKIKGTLFVMNENIERFSEIHEGARWLSLNENDREKEKKCGARLKNTLEGDSCVESMSETTGEAQPRMSIMVNECAKVMTDEERNKTDRYDDLIGSVNALSMRQTNSELNDQLTDYAEVVDHTDQQENKETEHFAKNKNGNEPAKNGLKKHAIKDATYDLVSTSKSDEMVDQLGHYVEMIKQADDEQGKDINKKLKDTSWSDFQSGKRESNTSSKTSNSSINCKVLLSYPNENYDSTLLENATVKEKSMSQKDQTGHLRFNVTGMDKTELAIEVTRQLEEPLLCFLNRYQELCNEVTHRGRGKVECLCTCESKVKSPFVDLAQSMRQNMSKEPGCKLVCQCPGLDRAHMCAYPNKIDHERNMRHAHKFVTHRTEGSSYYANTTTAQSIGNITKAGANYCTGICCARSGRNYAERSFEHRAEENLNFRDSFWTLRKKYDTKFNHGEIRDEMNNPVLGSEYVQRYIVKSSPIIASLRDLKPDED